MNDQYKSAIDRIQASDQFIENTLLNLYKRKESRIRMKIQKKILVSVAACFIVALGLFTTLPKTGPEDMTSNIDFDLRDRIEVSADAIQACGAVNIEGTIKEVSKDGLSFRLDTGKWIIVTPETEIGITSPSAADKADQFFEPTFRVGNMISGFAEESKLDSKKIEAYVIYSNWNWNEPIR